MTGGPTRRGSRTRRGVVEGRSCRAARLSNVQTLGVRVRPVTAILLCVDYRYPGGADHDCDGCLARSTPSSREMLLHFIGRTTTHPAAPSLRAETGESREQRGERTEPSRCRVAGRSTGTVSL